MMKWDLSSRDGVSVWERVERYCRFLVLFLFTKTFTPNTYFLIIFFFK